MDIIKIIPEVQKNISVESLSTFKVGGIAKHFLEVNSKEQAILVFSKIKQNKIPYAFISGGSNVVFNDGIIKKLIVKINTKGIIFNDKKVYVQSGEKLSNLVKKTIDNNLMGLETLSCIPGSVGGAIVGNAGAYGKTISDSIFSVEVFDGKNIKEISKNKCGFVYRDSIFKKNHYVILGATFLLKKTKKDLKKISRHICNIRRKKYKKGILCAGSFFKNIMFDDLSDISKQKIDPKKIKNGKVPAGYLLDSVGACGLIYKGIKIAPFHGNLLINEGSASFKDVVDLSSNLKKEVFNKFKINLEEEIRYIC